MPWYHDHTSVKAYRREEMTTKRTFSNAFSSFRSNNPLEFDPSKLIKTSDYEVTPIVIGQGASASVYKGTYKGSTVAVKKFAFDNPSLPTNKALLLKEASELLKLNHSNVILCHGVCVEDASLIMEFASKHLTLGESAVEVHSVRQMIEAVGEEFPYDLKLEAIFQVSEGLAYLHSLSILHGDLKSGNVNISINVYIYYPL